MARCLISFGANLGQPLTTIRKAASLIERMLTPSLNSFAISRMFRTPAVGGPSGQPPFINAVAALELNGLTAWDIWHVVREVEHQLGRVRQERWEARRIDLDVLLFDEQRIWTQHFKLPHPRMVMRRFILEPALDVAADWVEPVSGWSLRQLARNLRHTPASILLVSYDLARDHKLMEQAAEVCKCQWLTPQLVAHPPNATEKAASSNEIGPTQPASPTERANPTAPSNSDQTESESRWLGIVSMEQLDRTVASVAASRGDQSVTGAGKVAIVPRPGIVFVLTPPGQRPGGAWEDIHRGIARRLGIATLSRLEASEPLLASPVAIPPTRNELLASWPLSGPRYLLSTDDARWAEHEIVAALDAMDCPVEPDAEQ